MKMIWLCFVFLIVGLIWFLSTRGNHPDPREAGNWGGGICLFLAVLFFVFSALVVIPPGHVGVKVLFGEVKPEIVEEGLHGKNPFVRVEKMTIQTQSYTMSGIVDEGEKDDRSDAIEALSKDNLSVTLDITVLYKLVSADAPEIYRILGSTSTYTEKVLRPGIRTAIRNSASKYKASEIMSQKRNEVEQDITSELQRILTTYFKKQNIDHGLFCEGVMLRNVDPPQKVKDAINEKLKAEQDAQAMEFKIQRATKEAEKRRIDAQGIADAQKIIDKNLTQQYLQWYYIETMKDLVDSPNNSTLILPFDQKLVPLLQTK